MSGLKDALVPVVKAEEEEEVELVDPQPVLKEKCSQMAEAQKLWDKYQECSSRVLSRSKTAETCEEELIDYVTVVDHCVAKDLFHKLK